MSDTDYDGNVVPSDAEAREYERSHPTSFASQFSCCLWIVIALVAIIALMAGLATHPAETFYVH